MRDRNYKAIALRDFSDGLNLKTEPWNLRSTEVQDCRNYLFDEKDGVVIKRPGAIKVSTATGDVAILRCYNYIKSSGVSYVIIQLSNFKIYKSIDRVDWTEIVPATAAAVDITFDELCDFEVFEDILWITNKSQAVCIFDGTNSWVLNGETYTGSNYPTGKSNPWITPDVPKGKYVKLFNSRLSMTNTTDNPSEVRFSQYYDSSGNDIYAYDENAWPAVNQLAIAQDDGEQLTGHYVFQGNFICFKNKSIHVVRGQTPADYSIDKIATGNGTTGYYTIKIYKNMLVWLSDDGIYGYNGATVKKLSEKMQSFFDTILQKDLNSAYLIQSTTDQFNDGDYGAEVIDVSGDELKQLPQDEAADFNAGTLDQTVVSGDTVILGTTDTKNLALSGTATANYTLGSYYPSNANDDDLNTKWYGSPDFNSVWLKIDLGSSIRIRKFTGYIRSVTEGNGQSTDTNPLAFKLQGSNNDSDWTDIADITPSGTFYENFSEEFESTYRYYRLLWAHTPGYYTVNAYVAEFRLLGYYTTGNIISQTLDFGVAPTALGNLASSEYIPTGTDITYQTRTSDDNITWDSWVDLSSVTISGGVIDSTPRRYLQWKAILTSNATQTETPILYGVYIGSVWQSANLELGLTPTAWGRFEVDEDINNQTIVYRIKSAATEGDLAGASWVTVADNSIPSTLTLNPWVKIETRFNTTRYDQIPVTYSMILNYFTGNNAIQDAYAVIHKDRYLLSCTSQDGTYSNRVVCMNAREGKGIIFSLFTGWNIASMCNYVHDLIGGSSTDGDILQLWAGLNDNGVAIDAWFKPARLTFKMADNLKLIRKIFLNVAKPSDCTLNVKYAFDAGTEYGFAIAITAGAGSLNTPLMFPAGVKGKLLDLKFQSNVLDEESEIIGVEIYYRTLKLRKLNVDTISGGGMAQFTWTQATRPTNPYLGQIGFNTDFKGAEQYVGSGLWKILSGEWTVATRPITASIAVGSKGYNTDTGYTAEIWTGTEWVNG